MSDVLAASYAPEPTMSGRPCRMPHRAAIALAIALVLVPAGATAGPATTVARARWLMGTLWTAEVTADDTLAAGRALDAALDTVATLEGVLSNWRPTSALARLNDAGAVHALPPALGAVLDSALGFARDTEGAFDPTVESLVRAWDLRGEGRVPSAHDLAAARARVDHRRVALVRDTAGIVRGADLHGTVLDLGGIGKGFALDRAAAVLTAQGFTRGALDAGGQRLTLADTATVWLASPRDRDVPAVAVRLATRSIATSVQRERSLVVRGRRVGHVLDPRTGEPVRCEAAVSVAAASGTRADAHSTALLVMGREAAHAYARVHPELGVLWLEPQGRTLVAHAWNLTVVALAPGVRLADPSPRHR